MTILLHLMSWKEVGGCLSCYLERQSSWIIWAKANADDIGQLFSKAGIYSEESAVSIRRKPRPKLLCKKPKSSSRHTTGGRGKFTEHLHRPVARCVRPALFSPILSSCLLLCCIVSQQHKIPSFDFPSALISDGYVPIAYVKILSHQTSWNHLREMAPNLSAY